MTEWLHIPFSLSCIGEGNGNPLQCSCLENPRDGGAWWAAVYGVAQSWTRLKRLSNSSSSSSSRVVLDSGWGHENICGSRHSPALWEPCRIFLTQEWGCNNFWVFVSLSLSPMMWLTFPWVKINFSSCPADLFAQLSGPPLAVYSLGLCFMKLSSRTEHSVLYIEKMLRACVCVIFENLFQ